MKSELFGTDGIRGPAGQFPIDEEGAWRFGLATARHMARGGGAVYLGRDTRPSGPALSAAVAEGIMAAGCDVIDLGVLPTPGIAQALAAHGGAAAVALSASHNAAPDNGFKLFGPGGEKVTAACERAIETLFWANEPVGAARGTLSPRPHAADEYVDFAVGTMPAGLSLRGLKVAVDCGHGATAYTTPTALARLGVDVVAINADDQGELINASCGSQHPAAVREAADRCGAALGLAHDGDGDRVVFVDEQRATVDGDRIIGLTAQAMARRGELDGQAVVGTVLSNIGLELWLREQGIALHRSRVGDRNVWLKMLELGAVIGGEPSGHLIFRRLLSTDDALLTAMQLLAVVAESGRPLCELAQQVALVPQAVKNVRVLAKPELEGLSPVSEAIAAGRALLNGHGRLIVRYSGTENLARIMAEGPDAGLLGQVVGFVETAFGVAGLATAAA
ncbi:MAG: phosphoglucosamine mutase [Armatimonadetes bacterium]|nr:phosphoglucosamine mutase [Armatimonadota bacterium]